MRWKELFGLVKETARGWSERQTFQLGAALAFYAAFALAPVLVIAVAVSGILFGDDAAQGRLSAVLHDALGDTVARSVIETLTQVHVSRSGWTASAVGFGLVLFAATGLFAQLQMALNAIWGVRPKPGRGLWSAVRGRLFAFVLVLAVGALLLVSLVASTAVIVLHRLLPPSSGPTGAYLMDGVNVFVWLGLLTALLAMIYKLLPDVVIRWRDVGVGAFVTAMLFAFGNYLISQYLCRPSTTFVYGAAGSVMIEFTKNYAKRYGRPARPAEHAMFLSA